MIYSLKIMRNKILYKDHFFYQKGIGGGLDLLKESVMMWRNKLIFTDHLNLIFKLIFNLLFI